MNPKIISEIQITPTKPQNGLIAFCSFVLFEKLYCSSVAVFTRPTGGYRLVYPTKKVGLSNLDIFHPINRELGELIEKEVIEKLENVMKQNQNDRYCSPYN